MPWPTWDQALVVALASALVWRILSRLRPGRAPQVVAVAAELTLISSLYGVWRLARMLPIASEDGAVARGYDIAAVQRWLHLPSEVHLQHIAIEHRWLAEAADWYYASVHAPATVAFLIWLFARHRDHYPHWRNALALVTAGCLVIRFVRVAPPRFFPDLGFVDLSHFYGPSIYSGDPTTGVSDQFAAMPSIHIGWAAVVSFGIVAASRSRWRWVFALHVVITGFVVVATGNHWWLDGIVALGLLVGALALDTAVRGRLARRLRAEEAANGSRTGDRSVLIEHPVGSHPDPESRRPI